MSQQFYKIQVSQVFKTTEDCSVITFDISKELEEKFSFIQGQYLTLKTMINGEEIRRSYSLCSSPIDKEWKVAVKKIDDGRFSTYVNDELKEGDVLEVMPPSGRFFQEVDVKAKRNYVAFAAGSGITPIHSIIKTHLNKEPNSTFTLFYLNRSVQSMILREEIEGLKNQFLGRFELYHFLTQEQRDAPLFNGGFTKEKLATIAEKLIEVNSIDDYFICGPTEMIFLIRDFLKANEVDEKKIHFELFNTPTGGAKKKKLDENNKDVSEVSIITNGVQVSFKMTQNGEKILDAALRNNADLPFACKGGVCCTCKAKLIEGEAPMEVNYALEKEEVEQGYILTCQAMPKSSKILVDFDS
ncbi:MAG: phenylacetate-CoA oxygenase/reductase subunit PaaK [Flavobacteriales bacterium]|nr:phenylacetate-CoA oxygenase/reductase subunit PaaK [Flavobacteriales bacterium]